MNYKFCFKRVITKELDIEEFNSFPNKSVLTTIDWIKFIEEDSKAVPYILRITRNDELVGYFSAMIIKKLGVSIMGSPFPGWSTPYMGLDLLDAAKKSEVLVELIDFIRKTENYIYLQISDRDFVKEELEKLAKSNGFIVGSSETLEVGIEGDDAIQYKKMKTDCRNFIKQFERRGAYIEQAIPNDEFAEEYYNQLLDVFDKQDLVPTYTVDKVKCLLKHLSSSNSVLCLRVKDPEGISIATSIFPGFNKKMFFWGGASLRPYQQYRPNEYMIYTAMRYWRERGCTEFDMVGNRAYKMKFGSWIIYYPVIIVPKYRVLVPLKNMAARLYYFSGKVFWKLHIKR